MLAGTLDGIRVVDLGTNIAGPFAAMILGDLGADVIKVERPPHGDDTRALPPQWNGESTVFLAMNRNKRSLVLDLKSPDGRDALRRLTATADVVVESFPPGYAARHGLQFQDFQAWNSRIILCSVSAFGDGPTGSTMPGYDALVQAMSGLMSFTGHEGAAPVRIAPSVLDLSTGLWGAIGIMAALMRKSAGRGESGEHIRPSLIDTAMTLMGHQLLGYLATGVQPEKLGSGAPSAVPYRVYAASDAPFMLATASDAQFRRLCNVIGQAGLVDDPRFATMAARIDNRDAIDEQLAAIFRGRSRDAWLESLGAAGLSVGPVNDVKAALDMPVTRERAAFVEPEAIGWSAGLRLLRLPIDPDGDCVRFPPPRLGEHSAGILRELG
jgi:crotonobetainyl-CoA:carnitine CoA-transferase CaiB-like acyl-CoA transferase